MPNNKGKGEAKGGKGKKAKAKKGKGKGKAGDGNQDDSDGNNHRPSRLLALRLSLLILTLFAPTASLENDTDEHGRAVDVPRARPAAVADGGLREGRQDRVHPVGQHRLPEVRLDLLHQLVDRAELPGEAGGSGSGGICGLDRSGVGGGERVVLGDIGAAVLVCIILQRCCGCK